MSGVAYPLAGPRSRRAVETERPSFARRSGLREGGWTPPACRSRTASRCPAGTGGRSVRRRFTTKTRRARRRGVPGPQNKVTHGAGLVESLPSSAKRGRVGVGASPPKAALWPGDEIERRTPPACRSRTAGRCPAGNREQLDRGGAEVTGSLLGARDQGTDRIWTMDPMPSGERPAAACAPDGKTKLRTGRGGGRDRPDGAGRHRPGDEIERPSFARRSGLREGGCTPCPAEIPRQAGSKLNDGPHAKRSGRCGEDEPLDRDRFARGVWSTRKTRNSTLSHFAYESRASFDWSRPSVPRSAGLRSGGSAD